MKLPSDMARYQTISRRFRPLKFLDVRGQEHVTTTLKNSVSSGKIGAAYLFCGIQGTGKTTLARILARAVNCTDTSENGEPCNNCNVCMSIINGESIDVVEIDGASTRGIDDIRHINEHVKYKTSQCKKRVYIIDEVHMLTKEASNALLKTLEEPPQHVIFCFATTEPHKILPTILSRCLTFHLYRISREEIESRLSYLADLLKVDIEEGALTIIAQQAEGSMRDAESCLEQLLCYTNGEEVSTTKAENLLGRIPIEFFAQIDLAVKNEDMKAPFAISETVLSQGYSVEHFLYNIVEHYRMVILTKTGAIQAPSKIYVEASKIYTMHHLISIMKDLASAIQDDLTPQLKRVVMESTLLNIIHTANHIPLNCIVDRLEELRSSLPDIKECKESNKEENKTKENDHLKQLRQERAIQFTKVELGS